MTDVELAERLAVLDVIAAEREEEERQREIAQFRERIEELEADADDVDVELERAAEAHREEVMTAEDELADMLADFYENARRDLGMEWEDFRADAARFLAALGERIK